MAQLIEPIVFVPSTVAVFQFLNGAIRATQRQELPFAAFGFNSCVVQYKLQFSL